MSLESLINRIAHGTDERALPKLDLFEQEQVTRQIVEHGLAALPLLFSSLDRGGLPPHMTRKLVGRVALGAPNIERDEARAKVACYLTSDKSLSARTVAVQVLSENFSAFEDAAMAVLQLAEDREGAQGLRREALSGLSRMRLSVVATMRLLRILQDQDPDIVLLALSVLAHQESPYDVQPICQALLELVTADHSLVRHQAIGLLGRFGDIDMLEYVCMLPTTTPAAADAVRDMVRYILSKPRNILALSPMSFERLIRQLLKKMGFEDVRDCGGPGDGGIDVEAFKLDPLSDAHDRRRRILVQCKRYRHPIGPDEITKFIERTLKPAQVAHGLFIVTSSFSEPAKQVRSGFSLDLIDGKNLQRHLDEHFGPVYCIRP